ncbi:MAG: hypothetical protein JWR35_3669, partial [Marmoricola sp.]|nr:hypothetical protein [Marmoricola sp.]
MFNLSISHLHAIKVSRYNEVDINHL